MAPSGNRELRELLVIVERFLDGLDCVLVIECSLLPTLWFQAKKLGIRTVLIPNAEWFFPEDPEMEWIDHFIAPTRSCLEYLAMHGLGERSSYIPYPVDTNSFPFAARSKARLFAHYSGWGGHEGRKGTTAVLDAAAICPEIPFVIFSQAPLLHQASSNVKVFGPVRFPHEQYGIADVAIQPSRWEGVGLQILEPMCCGIPTVTTDAPPMNEHVTDRNLLLSATPGKTYLKQKEWTANDVTANHIAQRVRAIFGSDIREMSLEARHSMERRSWTNLRDRMWIAVTGA
jgi:glycosyltransferase involved in cell wall biosynthesis